MQLFATDHRNFQKMYYFGFFSLVNSFYGLPPNAINVKAEVKVYEANVAPFSLLTPMQKAKNH